jgi:Trypsin
VTRHRRGLPVAVGGALLALVLVVVGLPKPASEAAQGQPWHSGVPWAGVLRTSSGWCSVTVVSEFLAITAKHCGTAIQWLKLDVASAKEPGHDYRVKEVIPNPDLDVEAIVLRDRSGLTVTPLRATVERTWFYAWGYGADRSNEDQEHLTRADFNQLQPCPANAAPGMGSLCWPTEANNSVCSGDTGGPLIQNGAIIGMQVTAFATSPLPGGGPDCSTVETGRALTVQDMQPWLNQMIDNANPLPGG